MGWVRQELGQFRVQTGKGILETSAWRKLRMWILFDPATSLPGVHVREISTRALQVACAGALVEVAMFVVGDTGANLGFITREVDKMW